ncbi:MAG: DUF3854 domain-containing protein [Actinomycetota bacterium]|nr:DUF3854 domain-containing protein [Actinomycetota bacterium]
MVTLALMRLAERLTQRLAQAYIVSLPGPEKGVDDYIRAGGSLEDLEEGARPYDPSLLLPYICTEDRKIWEIVEAFKRQMSVDTWPKVAGKTDNSYLRTLLEMALERGRNVKGSHDVEVTAGRRELMERAAIGSPKTLCKSGSRLEERGYIEVIQGDRRKGQANRYRLKFAKVEPLIGEGRGGSNPTTPIPGIPSENFMPRHGWPGPYTTATPSATLRKPGKSRELALYLLVSWGGETSIRDLAAAVGTNNTTKTRDLLEAYEGAGVVEMDRKGKHGARVRLAADWQKRLDEYRDKGGEIADARRRANRRYKDDLTFHSPPKADREPKRYSREEKERILEEASRRDYLSRRLQEERKTGTTPAVFLKKTVTTAGFRWKELLQLWRKQGGSKESLQRAVQDGPWLFQREPDDLNELYVLRGDGSPTHKLPKPEPKKVGPVDAL